MIPRGSKPDIETLKAWCHWKRKEYERTPDARIQGWQEIRESELELVTAVENVISQVGTWKAKCLRAEEAYSGLVQVEIDLRNEIEGLRAAQSGNAEPEKCWHGNFKGACSMCALDAKPATNALQPGEDPFTDVRKYLKESTEETECGCEPVSLGGWTCPKHAKASSEGGRKDG